MSAAQQNTPVGSLEGTDTTEQRGPRCMAGGEHSPRSDARQGIGPTSLRRRLKQWLAIRRLNKLVAKRQAELASNPHRQASLKGWNTRRSA